jgi:methylenetetrahydrofolate dehydrogenase (NADP+) / methenyltetrahydrofolate cyclohydrolase
MTEEELIEFDKKMTEKIEKMLKDGTYPKDKIWAGPTEPNSLIKDYVTKQKKVLKERISKLETKPNFKIIQVGNVEASNRYVRNKVKDCEEVGIKAEVIHLDEAISEIDLLKEMQKLNEDNSVDAYMVQFPLPGHINQKTVEHFITPLKDADGFTNNGITNPATPQGIVTFLERRHYKFEDENALIIGRSDIVGKPMARILLEHNCNVIQIHSKTSESQKRRLVQLADLIIVATGHINTITKDYFDPNTNNLVFLFDVGINFDENGKLVGDCEKNLPILYQSPVPGGVGLLTRLQLVENILELYEVKYGN